MYRQASILVGAVTMVLMGALTPSALTAQRGHSGFMFREPTISFTMRAGYDARRAESDLFGFTRELFTVDARDFDGPAFGGEVAFRVGPRVDLALGVLHSRSTVLSEYRDWVDTDDLPIQQETEFRTTPLTLSARVYLMDRGRSIGRFAWVPRRVTPYVGGGIGVVWYHFQQEGDFIDFDSPTLDIFYDFLSTRGEAFTAHGLAGLDVSLTEGVLLNTEARLGWAEGEVAGSFIGYDKMDLAGLQVTMGFKVRF